jgi:hypothetical protein
MKNDTNVNIHGLSLVSQNGKVEILVPDTLAPDSTSRVYEKELTGEFRFAVFSEDSLIDLGVHALGGGSILARIKEEKEGKFTMSFK